VSNKSTTELFNDVYLALLSSEVYFRVQAEHNLAYANGKVVDNSEILETIRQGIESYNEATERLLKTENDK